MARIVGLEYIVNPLLNEEGEIMAMVAGHPEKAFWHGVKIGEELYATPLPQEMDVAVFNAWPKDTEGTQAGMATVPIRGKPFSVLKEGGTLVIAAACSEGLGFHSVMGPGTLMRVKWGAPAQREVKGAPSLQKIVFAPGLNVHDVRTFFGPDVRFCKTWPQVLEILQKTHGDTARACVFPCGAMQHGITRG